MGGTPWNSKKWDDHKATVQTKSAQQIFTQTTLALDLDPRNIKVRESRDSDAHPNSTAVIAACDETGSMGFIAEHMFKSGVGTLMENILERKPVSDPHCMVMGLGDVRSDRSPIQVSQFEADTKILEWLAQVYVEGNGGGNNSESYDAAWYVAANMTSIDCFEKRGKKGYLFTIGDEEAPAGMTRHQISRFLNHTLPRNAEDEDDQGQDSYVLRPEVMLRAAERMYHCYHIIVGQGDHASRYPARVRQTWNAMMGERAVWLSDYHSLSEVIVSIIEVNEGRSVDDVVNSWSGNTAVAVQTAVKDLKPAYATNGKTVVRL